jgi:hypothetical protein
MLEGACHCGQVRWSFDGTPDHATACNCTVCRRYGVLWAYGHENQEVRVSGPTKVYCRENGDLGFHFCANCGCIAYWRPLNAKPDGRHRMGVNLRLAEPASVAAIPVDHLDGFDTWTKLPPDGRRVADMWF